MNHVRAWCCLVWNFDQAPQWRTVCDWLSVCKGGGVVTRPANRCSALQMLMCSLWMHACQDGPLLRHSSQSQLYSNSMHLVTSWLWCPGKFSPNNLFIFKARVTCKNPLSDLIITRRFLPSPFQMRERPQALKCRISYQKITRGKAKAKSNNTNNNNNTTT